jgi:hypothetical protein
MNKLIFIHELIEKTNGHSIVNIRLIESLKRQINTSFTSIAYDKKANVLINNVDLNKIDENDAVVILSHFNTFKLAPRFKKSKIVYINHDLPYYGYLSKGNYNVFKALYSWFYIYYYSKFSLFNFFISKLEFKKSGCRTESSAYIRIGIKPVNSTVNFKSLLPVAIFTGNYEWSLKRKSLQSVFKKKYCGSLELAAVNVDERFIKIASSSGVRINYYNELQATGEIRIGVITDKFLSGFKLKALELIRIGCCLVSFSDISYEFEDILYADLFIHTIKNINELDLIYRSLTHEENVVAKFASFYADINEKFNWVYTANEMQKILGRL